MEIEFEDGSSIEIRPSALEHIKVGRPYARWKANGDYILRYYVDFRHTILNQHKEVSAPEVDILGGKIESLLGSWEEKYKDHLKKSALLENKSLAEQRTLEAEQRRVSLRGILKHTLSVNDAVDWEILKDKREFKLEPFEGEKLERPVMPRIGFFQKLFRQREKIEREYERQLAVHNEKIEKQKVLRKEWYEAQEQKKRVFLESQEKTNAKVDSLKEKWRSGDPGAVIEHASIVLDASEYDDLISKEFETQYDGETKTLLIDYSLPSPDVMPTVKTVKFVAANKSFNEAHITEKDKKSLYDEICYQLCLRTIHEILEADEPSNIQKILFNGTADYIDRGTGKEVHATILSLMVDREEFLAINLARVDPKACFKNLKGVSASTLIGLSPIAPIMELDRSDGRFIEARQVNVEHDGSTNLASMDWEEFEHLVREMFHKEFSKDGGEVKVTQSSSDGGVDAVAFDPDPIRGGKIVIQAKRYTNTVGVDAVRDLYGTTMSEGANKGILVTTSDYGPDAYKFASDKPLTLISGANLLHLLGKHGIKARIDIKEARKDLGLK